MKMIIMITTTTTTTTILSSYLSRSLADRWGTTRFYNQLPPLLAILRNNDIESRKSRFIKSSHCAANCLQHVRSNRQGAIVCKSRATHRAFNTCNMPLRQVVRRDISAFQHDRDELAFILASFHWLKSLPMKGSGLFVGWLVA